eukprot:Gb_22059 [translate_table: standard]
MVGEKYKPKGVRGEDQVAEFNTKKRNVAKGPKINIRMPTGGHPQRIGSHGMWLIMKASRVVDVPLTDSHMRKTREEVGVSRSITILVPIKVPEVLAQLAWSYDSETTVSWISGVKAFVDTISAFRLETMWERFYDPEEIFASHMARCKMSYFHSLDLEDDFRNPVDYDWVAHKRRRNITLETSSSTLESTESDSVSHEQEHFENRGSSPKDLEMQGEEGHRGNSFPKSPREEGGGGDGQDLNKDSTRDVTIPETSERELAPNPWSLEIPNQQSTLVSTKTTSRIDFNRQHMDFEFEAHKRLVKIRTAKPKTSQSKAIIRAEDFSINEIELDTSQLSTQETFRFHETSFEVLKIKVDELTRENVRPWEGKLKMFELALTSLIAVEPSTSIALPDDSGLYKQLQTASICQKVLVEMN